MLLAISPSIRRSILNMAITLGLGGMVGPSTAQESPKLDPVEPRQPGAIDSAPAWLKDAPFDLDRFFAMPPAAENAAPLYLEAFAEFDGSVGLCFPPDRRAAAEAGGARWKRWEATYKAWPDDPAAAPAERVDAMLADFAVGFRKLDQAQARPRCVFAAGLSIESLLPGMEASRTAGRLLTLQAGRRAQQGDLVGALASLAGLFRLSRDVRPRGGAIVQLVSIAIDGAATQNAIPLLLASPQLRPEHCDRLIALLTDHEARGLDPFAIGVQAEYITGRVTSHPFEANSRTTADPAGRPVEVALDSTEVARTYLDFSTRFGHNPLSAEEMNKPATLERAKETAAAWGRDAARTRAVLDDFARRLLAARPTFPARRRAFESLVIAHLQTTEMTYPKMMTPDLNPLNLSAARHGCYLGAAKSLIALRRWQMTEARPPTDLAAVCRAARLPAVPTDPFSGGPLRLAILGGEPVVYAVGADGDDDHALIDSNLDRNPDGDLLFRLPRPR